MKKILSVLGLSLVSGITLFSCNNRNNENASLSSLVETHNPFDYDGNFTAPELAVDGIKEEAYDLYGTETLYINKGGSNEMATTIYRGNDGLYFFFEVKDNNLLTEGNEAGDAVTRSDSCELYLDTDNDGGNAPQRDDFQLNFAVNNKTRIFQGSGQSWGSWTGLVQYENVLNGTLNDDSDIDIGWNLEVMIPYKELGVDKNDDFGIALGRVDKVGLGSQPNTDYFWYGLPFNGAVINPQIPNEYAVYIGNQLYSKDDVPTIRNVFGVVKDSAGNVLVDVKVALNDEEVMTSSDGTFRFDSFALFNENTLTFEKSGYFNRTITFSNSDVTEEDFDLGDVYLIGTSETINTTFTGTIKNVYDGNISDAIVSFNDQSVKTDEDGNFTLEVSFKESATLTISKDGYTTNEFVVDSNLFNQNGISDLGTVDLRKNAETVSLSNGLSLSLSRGLNDILFTVSKENATEVSSGTLTIYVDAKATGVTPNNQNDYQFVFNVSSMSLTRASTLGSQSTPVSNDGFTFKKIDSNTTILNLRYEAINTAPLEVIGFTFAYKASGNDSEVISLNYDNNQTNIDSPLTYVRLATDNHLYNATNNLGGEVDPYNYANLGSIRAGNGNFNTSVTRDDSSSVFFKFNYDFDFSDSYASLYIDTNLNPTETRDEKTFEIIFNGEGTITSFSNFNSDGTTKNSLNDEIDNLIITTKNNQITLQIPNEILNIKSNSTIGVSYTITVNEVTSVWTFDNELFRHEIPVTNPSEYVRIDSTNVITTDPLSYTNLSTVGGKSDNTVTASTLRYQLSRSLENGITIKVTNLTRDFADEYKNDENIEFYLDTGDSARFGESAYGDVTGVHRDSNTFMFRLGGDGELSLIRKYRDGNSGYTEYKEEDVTRLGIKVTTVNATTRSIFIPYSFLNEISSEYIIGFTCGVYNNRLNGGKGDWCPYNYRVDRYSENAARYLRIDADGNIIDDSDLF